MPSFIVDGYNREGDHLWTKNIDAESDYDAHLIATKDSPFDETRIAEVTNEDCWEMLLQDYENLFREVEFWLNHGDGFYRPNPGEKEDEYYIDKHYLLERVRAKA